MSFKKKIVVGMSGGVDSTLAAILLKEEYEVTGVTLRLHQANPPISGANSCGNALALERAKLSADEAGISHQVVDCSERFSEETLRKCWASFEKGRTPNPCYICNSQVKFVELINAADRMGAERIATGHYARIGRDEQNRPVLQRGLDATKDQSYFLSGLPAEILARTIFPLGSMRKSRVRELAGEHGLASAALKESQDLCFTAPEGRFSASLCEKFSGTAVPGVFVDLNGRILGRHEGIHLFTIGQRKGLGFATGQRMMITEIDPQTGTITVSSDREAACSVYCRADPFSWSGEPLAEGEWAEAQVRYRQTPARAVVMESGNRTLNVRFAAPVFGVTPGQVLVLYREDRVIGSGIISR